MLLLRLPNISAVWSPTLAASTLQIFKSPHGTNVFRGGTLSSADNAQVCLFLEIAFQILTMVQSHAGMFNSSTFLRSVGLHERLIQHRVAEISGENSL